MIYGGREGRWAEVEPLVSKTSRSKDTPWVGEDPANQQQSWEHEACLQLFREILCEILQ